MVGHVEHLICFRQRAAEAQKLCVIRHNLCALLDIRLQHAVLIGELDRHIEHLAGPDEHLFRLDRKNRFHATCFQLAY